MHHEEGLALFNQGVCEVEDLVLSLFEVFEGVFRVGEVLVFSYYHLVFAGQYHQGIG